LIRKLAAEGAAPETVDPETGEIKPGVGAVDYSAWETEFLTEVDERLEKYGSAFHDLGKGDGDDALSRLQTVKLKEIAAKARASKRAEKNGKPRKGLTSKKGLTTKKPLGWKPLSPRNADE